MKKSWQLEDAGLLAKEAKYTFYKPPKETIQRLEVGNYVKLIFLFESDNPEHPRAERMWVMITEVNNEGFKGSLENDPYYIRDLKYNDLLYFEERHIIGVDNDEPGDSEMDKYRNRCLVTKVVIEQHAKVRYLYREEPKIGFDKGIVDSGWRIFAGDESDTYLTMGENFEFVSLGRVLNIDDSFIDLLEEPIGSLFQWNEELLKFE